MRSVDSNLKWGKVILLAVLVMLFCSGIGWGSEEGVPKDLDECNVYLDALMSQNDRETLQHTPVGELEQFHHSLGSWIENVWLTCDPAPLAEYLSGLGIHDVDSMSSVVIENYWYHLNQRPYDLAGAIAKYQGLEKEREEQQKLAQQKEKEFLERVQKNRMTLTVLPDRADEVEIPQRTIWGGVATHDLIPYGQGYIINSIRTYPKQAKVGFDYYYLNLVEGRLSRLQVSGVDAIESLVVKDGALYVSGIANGQQVIRKFADGKMENIGLRVSGSPDESIGVNSWVKLGFDGETLVALQRDGVYAYDSKGWNLLQRIEMKTGIIPTANIRIYGDRLYFFQEVLHEPSCELYYVDLQSGEGVRNVLDEWGLDTSYKEMIQGYGMDAAERLWVSASFGKDALISVEQGQVRFWVFDGKVETETGSMEFSNPVVFRADQRMMLMGQTGLYELGEGGAIEQIVKFRNTEQEVKVEEVIVDFHFSPRTVVYLGEDSYLIGSMLEGLYKLWKQDGRYQIVQYDDSMLHDLAVYRIE